MGWRVGGGGIFRCDQTGQILAVTSARSGMAAGDPGALPPPLTGGTGESPDGPDMVGKGLAAIVAPEEVRPLLNALAAVAGSGGTARCGGFLLIADEAGSGTVDLVRLGEPAMDEDPLTEQGFRRVAEHSPDLIIRYDRSLRRRYVNPAYLRAVGGVAAPLLAHGPDEVWPVPSAIAARTAYLRWLGEVLVTGEPRQGEVAWSGRDGLIVTYEVRLVPERDEGGALIGVLTFGHDIGTAQRLRLDLEHLAYHDGLTGLPNRVMLHREIADAIARNPVGPTMLAVAYIDLDGFKPVNDRHGHEGGDRVLVEMARRIKTMLREGDVLARIGGDEFAILLQGVKAERDCEFAMARVIHAISQPMVIADDAVMLSASIGISLYPSDEDDPDSLLRAADQAMFVAKRSGRNQFAFYGQRVQEKARRHGRLANDLRRGLELGQFTVAFQPLVDLSTGRVLKAEALARWVHPELGSFAPTDFIPIAEDTGLIHALGDWVFRRAMQVARRWNRLPAVIASGGLRRVSVNRSPYQFGPGGTPVERWIDYLRDAGIPGGALTVEITEGLLLDSRIDVVAELARLRAAGVMISLDDFGTGFSAMSYLKKFDLDELKIDRSFVRDMTRDDKDRAIVEAIIAIGRRLHMTLIAEGVETPEQAAILVGAGCHFAQGFHFGYPMTEEDFIAYIEAAEICPLPIPSPIAPPVGG